MYTEWVKRKLTPKERYEAEMDKTVEEISKKFKNDLKEILGNHN